MSHSFAATYEAAPHSVPRVRRQVEDFARRCGMGDLAIADVRLAVSEAATNALVHGCMRRAEAGSFLVQASFDDGELVIEVLDEGPGMQPRPDSPGLGLGMPVIATVADRVEILEREPGTHVRMAFACPAAA